MSTSKMYKHAKSRGFGGGGHTGVPMILVPKWWMKDSAKPKSKNSSKKAKAGAHRRRRRRQTSGQVSSGVGNFIVRRSGNGSLVTSTTSASGARARSEKNLLEPEFPVRNTLASPVPRQATRRKVWYFAYGSNLDQEQM